MRTFLISLFSVAQAFSQSLPIGSRSMALNSQETLVDEHAGSTFLNPALLTTQDHFSFWLNHYNPFGLTEIDVYALAANYAGKGYSIGAGYLQYGNALFHEKLYVAAPALRLSPKLHVGFKFKRRRLIVENYGEAGNVAFDFGVFAPVHQQLEIGFLVKNLAATEIGQSGEKPIRSLLTGARISLFDKAQLYFEIAQEQGFEPDYKLAFDFQPAGVLVLRAGTGLNGASSFAGGFGLRFSRIALDYAFQNHFALSQSHVFSFTILGGKR